MMMNLYTAIRQQRAYLDLLSYPAVLLIQLNRLRLLSYNQGQHGQLVLSSTRSLVATLTIASMASESDDHNTNCSGDMINSHHK